MSVATCCAPLGPGPHWSWAASLWEPRPAPSGRTQPSAPVYWTISPCCYLSLNFYHLFVLCCCRDGVQKIGVFEQVNSLIGWLHEDHGVSTPLPWAADVPPCHPLPLLVNFPSEHWHPHVGSNAATNKEQEEDEQDNA